MGVRETRTRRDLGVERLAFICTCVFMYAASKRCNAGLAEPWHVGCVLIVCEKQGLEAS